MHYTAYRRSFDAVAAAIAAFSPSLYAKGERVEVTSLAGGFYGILWRLTGDEGHVILARDLDGEGEWIGWCESPDGERWTDASYGIGHVRPCDYAVELTYGAAQTLAAQRAERDRLAAAPCAGYPHRDDPDADWVRAL